MNPQRAVSSRLRKRLLAAMMLIIVSLTGIAIVIAKRNVRENFEKQKLEEFESQLAQQHATRDVRLAVLGERCRRLAGSRIGTALETGSPDQLYRAAQLELPGILANDATTNSPGAILAPRFYRFVNVSGAVIPVPEKSLGSLDTEETFDEQDLVLTPLPQVPQVGFVTVKNPDGSVGIDEVIAVPIFLHDSNTAVAALVVGFRPIEYTDAQPASGKIQDGILLSGHLDMPKAPLGVIESITGKLQTIVWMGPKEATFFEKIGGVPHLIAYGQINQGSHFPPAYAVSTYSFAEPLQLQRELRWEILSIGLVLMIAVTGANRIITTRLSRLSSQ